MVRTLALVGILALLAFSEAGAQKEMNEVDTNADKEDNAGDSAEGDEYFAGNYLRHEDFIYDKNIKTVMLSTNICAT